MQQGSVQSKVLDKVLRRQQILAKQLELTAAVVAQITCCHGGGGDTLMPAPAMSLVPQVCAEMPNPQSIHQGFDQMTYQMGNWDNFENEQGDATTWLPERQVVSDCCEVFAEMPMEVVWDEDVQGMVDQDSLLKQLALGTNNFVVEDWVSAHQKLLPLQTLVVWDEISDDLAIHEGLLQQLAQGTVEEMHEGHGREDLFDKEKQLTAEFNQVSNTSLLMEPNIDNAVLNELPHIDVVWDDESLPIEDSTTGCVEVAFRAEELFEDMPTKIIVCDEKPTNISSHDGLLQQLACGKKYVHAKNTEPIVSLEMGMGAVEHMLLPMSNMDMNNDTTHVEEIPTWMYGGFSPGKIEQQVYQLLSAAMNAEKKYLYEAVQMEKMEFNVASSVRRQWDPGIMQVHVLQWIWCEHKFCNVRYSWTRCYDVAGKELLNTATAWGQAVFRGGGNVMTQRWPRTRLRRSSPSDGPGCSPRAKPGDDCVVYKQLLVGKGSSIRYLETEEEIGRASSSSDQRSYPSDSSVISHAPG